MVRLRKPVRMALFQNVGIKEEHFPEAEAWICVLKTAVAINSEAVHYDNFIYKSQCYLRRTESCGIIELCTMCKKCFSLRFASKNEQEIFIENMGSQYGCDPPPASPVPSATPSPPEFVT